MPGERLRAFLDAVKTDQELQEKLKTARDSNAIAKIASEAGYDISAEGVDLETVPIAAIELDGMTGGALPPGACMWPASYAAPSTATGSWGC